MALTPEEAARAQEMARIQATTTAKTFFKGYLKIMGFAILGGVLLMLGLCTMLTHL